MQKRLELFFGVLIFAAFIVWIAAFNNGSADNQNTKVYFLDVGQGDSEYIKIPSGEDILIDGGPDDKVLQELGKVMSFGDRKIDLVVLTHPHADHLTGLVDVLNRYEIGEVWESGVEYPSKTYDAWKSEIKNKNIPDKFVSAGNEKSFNNGQIKFKVLYPLSSLKNKTIDNVNNASVITRLDDNKFSVVFLGDAETQVQKQISWKMQKTTVLKTGHHGSRNGTVEEMLKIIRPAVAIISAGKDNKYGHPHAETLNLLKSYAVQIYRTDQNGTVEVSWDGVNYNVQTGK